MNFIQNNRVESKTTLNVLEGLLSGNELYSKGMGIILFIDSSEIHSYKLIEIIENSWREDSFLKNYSSHFITAKEEESSIIFCDLYKMKLEALKNKKPLLLHIQSDILKEDILKYLKFFIADAIVSFEGSSSLLLLETRLSGGNKKEERFLFDGKDISVLKQQIPNPLKEETTLAKKNNSTDVTEITTFNTRLTPEQEKAKHSVNLPYYSIQRNLQFLDPHHRLTSMAPTLAEDTDSDDPDDDLDV